MLLHQEKKESEDYDLMAWRSERKPKGVPRKKSLNKIQEIKQKPTEDPSEFLERIYQVYRSYTNTDPEVPENVRMINMNFIRQSTLEIKKLQKLDGVFETNSSQLADAVFKVQQQGTMTEKQGDPKQNTAALVTVLNVSNLKEGSQMAQWQRSGH